MSETKLEECANCGRTIGRLETPFLYQQQVVCAECHQRLTRAPSTPSRAAAADDDFADEMLASANSVAPERVPLNYSSSRVSDRSLRRAGVTPGHSKYVDHLRVPRLIMLLVAIFFSLLPAMSGQTHADYTFAWLLWAAWIALGLVSIVKKATWKETHGG